MILCTRDASTGIVKFEGQIIKFFESMADSEILMRVCYMGPDLMLEMSDADQSECVRIDLYDWKSIDEFIIDAQHVRKYIEHIRKTEDSRCSSRVHGDACASNFEDKPPLGVKPGTIAYEERIRELLGAVERNFEYTETCRMTSEERLGQLHRISAWLQEAILLTHLMGKLYED